MLLSAVVCYRVRGRHPLAKAYGPAATTRLQMVEPGIYIYIYIYIYIVLLLLLLDCETMMRNGSMLKFKKLRSTSCAAFFCFGTCGNKYTNSGDIYIYIYIYIVLVAAMGLQQRERGNANEADGRAELPLRMARSRARPQNGCASGGRTSKS